MFSCVVHFEKKECKGTEAAKKAATYSLNQIQIIKNTLNLFKEKDVEHNKYVHVIVLPCCTLLSDIFNY